MEGIVKAVCISEKRGVQKHDVGSAELRAEFGLADDAHAGPWHRQVSLLSFDKIEEFNEKGAGVRPGAFGENLVVSGIDFRALPVGTRFSCGEVLLELTQIGKECHSHCEIYKKMGDCIMPREGVFAAVVRGGKIAAGDVMTVIPVEQQGFRAAVITLSDKGYRGERADESGPVIVEALESRGYTVVEAVVLPDVQERIQRELINYADRRQVDLILTTGGTGFSPRDCTPEATMAVATRNAPGIAEAIRAYSMRYTGRAMLSRGASVIRGSTLIVNLPGSPKAVRESLECILDQLEHGLGILKGTAGECARQ